MAKRGLNIYKRKDGRWEGRYKSGYSADGKAKYTSIYSRSYSELKVLLEKKRAEANKCAVVSCKLTVGELIDIWLDDKKNSTKESTLANYAMKLQKHILPYFAGMKYEMLTAEKLNSFITVKIDEGLSPKYVSDIAVLIKSAAKFAQKRYGYVNRLESVTLPKTKKNADNKLLSDLEQARLKTIISKNPTSDNIGILLSLTTGIRIGELCALKWENIDLKNKILSIRKTVQRIYKGNGKGTQLIVTAPKSVSSIREIPLPDFIIPYLEKISTGKEYYLLSGSSKIVEPRTMQYRFKSLLKNTNLPYVCFHALRHMFATNCIAVGFDIKTLSEILGHSSAQITLDRYIHSSMERKRKCMELFSDDNSAA